MTDRKKIKLRIGFHRWSLLCLALAFLFALPGLLILLNPVFHAAGMKELASAGDNMRSSSDGQKATMGSTGASAAAAAAAASSKDPSPKTPLKRPPRADPEDDGPRDPFQKKPGSGKDVPGFDPNKPSGTNTGSKGSSSDGSSWKDWFLPDWWPWK